jgi:hypothetical protein
MRKSSDRVIGRSGHRKNQLTTEARRHEGKAGKWLWNIWNIFAAALREIFDEAPYRRFLERTRSLPSRESYREFMHERETASAQKPRCC